MNNTKITFEDLYANGYIQESVNTIAASIVKINPRLQMYSDDIKQELWLQINNAIKDYSPHGKASPETRGFSENDDGSTRRSLYRQTADL